jgi:hypothetical protein
MTELTEPVTEVWVPDHGLDSVFNAGATVQSQRSTPHDCEGACERCEGLIYKALAAGHRSSDSGRWPFLATMVMPCCEGGSTTPGLVSGVIVSVRGYGVLGPQSNHT